MKIKTEKDIEKQLGIKTERGCSNTSRNENVSNEKLIPSPGSWVQEKKSLIDKIASLKSETPIVVRNLNEKSAELSLLNVAKQTLENRLKEKDFVFSAQLDEMTSKLTTIKEIDRESKRSIYDLKRQNQLLIAQNKQFHNALAQNGDTNTNSDDSNLYEVENLLAHKTVSEKHYLIRWKGFNSAHDTWERESNLSCPGILKKYKQKEKIC